MEDNYYNKAPITEAVIELRFENVLSERELSKLSKSLGRLYSFTRSKDNFDLNVDVALDKLEKKKKVTYQLFSKDMTQVFLLKHDGFLVSQIAPYTGWDEFFSRFKRDYESWNKETPYSKLTQVGVRYINRIDIPTKDDVVMHEEYLNVYPSLPTTLDALDYFATQVQTTVSDVGGILRLNSGIVKSPIAKHLSFVLDQDIVKKENLPNSKEALFELLEKIRVKKNEIFEACITDKTREIFNAKS